jgi:hypothetical protein
MGENKKGFPFFGFGLNIEKPTFRRLKMSSEAIFYILLIGIGLLAPILTFAAVNLIYPNSTDNFSTNDDPPIKWVQGSDYAVAQNSNFTQDWALSNYNASHEISIYGLSGGNLVIDEIYNVTASASVYSFKVQLVSRSGALAPTELSLNFINSTGSVITSLNLLDTVGTETDELLGGQDYAVQLNFTLPDNSLSTDTLTVLIAPSSIVLQ